VDDHPRVCSHGRVMNWPKEIWIGISDLEWPIQAFISADQAADWVGRGVAGRHAYKVSARVLAEVLHVPPAAATHEVIPLTDAP
jgi:hypothetical protein